MKHRIAHKSNLGRPTAHRLSMFKTMVTQLVAHEGIKTTAVKMRALRPLVDRLVTLAKGGLPHQRRQVMQYLRDEGAARKALKEWPERYAGRPGGYTTHVVLPARRGDGAPMVYMMMLDSHVHALWKETAAGLDPVMARKRRTASTASVHQQHQ